MSIVVACVLLLFLIGVPVGVSFALVGFGATLSALGSTIAMRQFEIALSSSVSSFALISIPMYVLTAQLVIVSGAAERLIASTSTIASGLPGSLLLGSRFATTLFSAVTGSSVASTATMASTLLKDMVDRGYNRSLSAGSVAAGGGLAVIMPPSILLIIFGYLAEVSIASLFIAAVIPAFVLAFGYTIYNVVISIRRPDLSPTTPSAPMAERVAALAKSGPVIALGVVVLGSIYLGIATVTEASVLGVAFALLLTFYYRTFTLKRLASALMETAHITAFVFLIIVGTQVFQFYLNYAQVTHAVAQFVLGYEANRYVVLLLVLAMFILLGTFMDPLSMVLIAAVVVLKPMRALGFDPVWLGVLFTIAMEIGLLHPPFGMNLFVVQGVAERVGCPITYVEVVRGTFPYVLIDVAVLLLLVAFPALTLGLL